MILLHGFVVDLSVVGGLDVCRRYHSWRGAKSLVDVVRVAVGRHHIDAVDVVLEIVIVVFAVVVIPTIVRLGQERGERLRAAGLQLAVAGPLHHQQSRQDVDENATDPGRHGVRLRRAKVNVEHDDGHAYAEGVENHCEEHEFPQ